MNHEEANNWLKSIFFIILIAFVLFYGFQVFLGYKYKAYLLLAPCQLCSDLNPHLQDCFDDQSIIVKDSGGNIIGKGKGAIPVNQYIPYNTSLNWGNLINKSA